MGDFLSRYLNVGNIIIITSKARGMGNKVVSNFLVTYTAQIKKRKNLTCSDTKIYILKGRMNNKTCIKL